MKVQNPKNGSRIDGNGLVLEVGKTGNFSVEQARWLLSTYPWLVGDREALGLVPPAPEEPSQEDVIAERVTERVVAELAKPAPKPAPRERTSKK